MKSIQAVLSYHSGIVSVTAKDGGGGVGEPLAKQVASITGYAYIAKWTEYELTGQFMDWLDEQNVKGAQLLEREGRLSLERAIRLLAQIASALDYDINRNFPPAWQAETCGARGGRYGPTGCKADGGGSSPLSEP